MTRAEVFEKVQDIFRDIFDNPDLVVTDESNSSTIDDWDSLNHINLVVAIEKEFKIKFNLSELAALKNVGAMVDMMMDKLIK